MGGRAGRRCIGRKGRGDRVWFQNVCFSTGKVGEHRLCISSAVRQLRKLCFIYDGLPVRVRYFALS